MKQSNRTDIMLSCNKKLNPSESPMKAETKRDRHMETDRRRRMRFALRDLECFLPKKPGRKRTAVDILDDALVYIRNLQKQNAVLIEKAIEKNQ